MAVTLGITGEKCQSRGLLSQVLRVPKCSSAFRSYQFYLYPLTHLIP